MAIGDGVSALASLGVTFGGFSPTAMDEITASREYVAKLERLSAEQKAAQKRKRELERARTSKQKAILDEQGTKWHYVIVDQSLVRIVACESIATRLLIPDSIENMPVYALGPDACSKNDYVEEVICPDSLEFIGSCAFRFCPKLKRIVFPENVMEFSSTWLSNCESLESIVLPGGLDTIGLSVFDNPSIRHLAIGKNVRRIAPGAFQKTQLETVVINPDNPFIKTDGVAIYTMDGTVLLAIALPVRRYEVLGTCQVIAKKAAYNLESLDEVVLPDSVEALDEFAFSHSGIESFTAPKQLKTLGAKAFYYCRRLKDARLNEGLLSVGESAFEESGLESLHLPASIEKVGNSITVNTDIIHSGPHCTLTIDSASKSLFLDGEGGLFRRREDGVHFVQLIDRGIQSYACKEAVDFVDDFSFAYHDAIMQVKLPDGVRSIGKSAFRCCSNLVHVELPDSVVTIGDDAFLDTALESFRVPAALEMIGSNALVTKGAHHGDEIPSLQAIEVAEENERFFMCDGMLCLHDGGISRIIMFSNSASRVAFPENAESVESYAFNNARGIDYLEINPRMKAIGTAGLTTWCWIEHIHVEAPKPIEGRTSFDFRFPNTRKGIHGISMGLGGASWVNVPGMMAQYDNCVVNAHDYHSPRNPDSIPIYDQANMIVNRLKDPILLSRVNRSMYERLLRNYIVEICVDISRHDDRGLIDDLIEMGFVNESNLEGIISEVGRLQDAAMTGYLLEVKRRRYKRAIFDFDL